MTQSEHRQIELIEAESSQRQHHECMHHYEKMIVANESSEYNKFAMLKPKLSVDGNQWCCLYGDNLIDGVVGYGESPHKAVMAWNQEWFKQLKGE